MFVRCTFLYLFLLLVGGAVESARAATPERVEIRPDASAHWLDTGLLVWREDPRQFANVRLYHGTVKRDPEAFLQSDADSVLLTSGTATAPLLSKVPHLAGWPAFRVPLVAEDVKKWLKGPLLVVGFDKTGTPLKASHVQTPHVLDALYTSGNADANEAQLGPVYNDEGIDIGLWAPTAQNVALSLYRSDKSLRQKLPMQLDSKTGIWHARLGRRYDRAYYRFAMTLYHPEAKKVVNYEVTDPYSLSVSSNGRFSQLLDPNDPALMPKGWQNHSVPEITAPEQAVFVEAHLRDFSVRDATVSPANRGKYQALTEKNSAPVRYLKALAQAGVTHLHFLPLNDMGTLEEDGSQWLGLDDPMAQLCAKYPAAAVFCSGENSSKRIGEVLASFPPESNKAQALNDVLRPLDGFNWGYDPQHFTAPEGSYASEPDGPSALLEMRAMVLGAHNAGLRTILDVVYNHTTAAGLGDKSVLDKIVPGYYHRLNEITGALETSTCCANTASEHRMMAKLVIDSLVSLARIYKYDGFRFDLMEHMPKDLILAARDAVRAVDPHTYFYGEGWNFGEVTDNRLFQQAKQWDMAGSEVATFNDRLRDAVRSGALFADVQGDAERAEMDLIRLGLAGTLRDYRLEDFHGAQKKGAAIAWRGQRAGYALDPADVVNYVSKHDNETLWDSLQYAHPPGRSIDDRVRAHNIAAAIPLMSQGMPFFQFGVDLLRSKSMDRNSYDSGDWFNFVDFSMQSNNWNVGLPPRQENQAKYSAIKALAANPNARATPKDIRFARDVFREFLQIRASSPLFSLQSAGEIIRRLRFHNTGRQQTPNLIVMSLDDGQKERALDPRYRSLVVVINGAAKAQRIELAGFEGYRLHPVLRESVDPRQRQSSFADVNGKGVFSVAAMTLGVFVKER